MATIASQRHKAACSNRDYDFFYEGLEEARLLIQRCDDCGTLRNPPMPMCPACRSVGWTGTPMRGTGTIHSYTVHHHPPLPDFPVPHPVALIELDEGVRFLGAMDSTEPEDVKIGARVEAEFLRRGDFASLRFRAVP
ncbi:MAG: Zn-ribbon domain-containing OB-fold protein [Sphingobium sp.]